MAHLRLISRRNFASPPTFLLPPSKKPSAHTSVCPLRPLRTQLELIALHRPLAYAVLAKWAEMLADQIQRQQIG